MTGPGEPLAAELLPLRELTPWERNPRVIDRAGFDLLCAQLRREPSLLWARPLIVRRFDGAILAGNMRYRAAAALGWTHVPVVIVDADEQRSIEIALRDNTQAGDWNEEALAELLAELGDPSDEEAVRQLAEQTGMREREVAGLFAGGGEPPDVPEPDWSERTCPSCGHRWKDL